ncbi:MAG: protein kinase [Acidobacteriota bacterium]
MQEPAVSAVSSREIEINELLEAALRYPVEQWRTYLERTARDSDLFEQAEAVLRKKTRLDDASVAGRAAERPVQPRRPKFFDLVEWVVDVPADERRGVLRQHTDDAVLVQLVLALLDSGPAFDAATSDASPLPLQWGRFQIRRFLGAGGMGLVLEAFDTELERRVALKLIKGLSASAERRFQQEARAQAAIEHEHVCRVYDVGEIEGRPYIAMQYIEGRTLDKALDDLGLEQKVHAMIAACEGLHAAHRNGLIHRDVKPGNILVGQTPDGGMSVHVMDFGIARELSGGGLTRTGATLGTPHYMAPEQIHSATGSLDRRTDVYSLGATLFRVLTGRTPFVGPGVVVMGQVLGEDAPSPRGLVPSLPRDLDTIVLKCLEKDPGRRYDSARALADDLRRYLDGAPIEARRASPVYRIGRFIQKHRFAVAMSVVALVLLGLATSSLLAERLRASAVAEAAERFGRDVESLTWIKRAAHQLPLHDVRADYDLLRERMRSIEAQMTGLGAVGHGPGLYALGQGHLALGEIDAATEKLEAAWDGGFREPAVAVALGRTLAARYETGLAEVRRIPDGATREARLAQVEERYREPAIELLRRGRDADLDATELVAARIALLESRWDEAEQLATQVVERLPWHYDAHLIVGRAALERAWSAQDRGAYDDAEAFFSHAETAYRRATEVGSSDPDTWLALCRLGRSQALHVNERRARDAEAHYRMAIEACEKSLVARPDQPAALGELATILGDRAHADLARGEDPGPDLERGLALSQRAVEIEPRAIEAWRALGTTKMVKGRSLATRGEDAVTTIDEAIESLERVVSLDPDYAHARHLLNLALLERAKEAERRKEDAEPWLIRAGDEVERAIELAPNFLNAYLGASVIHWRHAKILEARGEDSLPLYNRGIEILRRVLELDPELGFAYVNLAALLHAAATATVDAQGDPVPLLDEAIVSLESALERVPEDPYAYFNLGHTWVFRGLWEAGSGSDPLPFLDRARGAFTAGIERSPKLGGPYASRGEAWLYEALWREARGEDPSTALSRAATVAERCRELAEHDPEHVILSARITMMRSRRGDATRADLDRIRADLAAVRAIGGEAMVAKLTLAAVDLDRARRAVDSDEEPARSGRAILDEILADDPDRARALALRAAFVRLEGAHNTTEAAALFARATELDPTIRLELEPMYRAVAR